MAFDVVALGCPHGRAGLGNRGIQPEAFERFDKHTHWRERSEIDHRAGPVEHNGFELGHATSPAARAAGGRAAIAHAKGGHAIGHGGDHARHDGAVHLPDMAQPKAVDRCQLAGIDDEAARLHRVIKRVKLEGRVGGCVKGGDDGREPFIGQQRRKAKPPASQPPAYRGWRSSVHDGRGCRLQPRASAAPRQRLRMVWVGGV